MSKLRDAARQALEALEKEPADYADWIRTMKAARAALRTALAEQPAEQEPVNIGPEWAPCVKLPVTVHVRQQRPGETHVSTREGITPIKPDDLIMRGVSGEEYPIGREIFERTYRLAEAPQPAKPAEQEPVEIEMPEHHSHGMRCGLEDRGITDRYEAMEYGWYEAIDRVKEELANFGPLYTAPQPAKPAEQEPVASECTDPMCACRGGPCAVCQDGEREKEVADLRASLDFYKRRADALQKAQQQMRDPERTIVCDILANGHLLDPAGGRYTAPQLAKREPLTDEDIAELMMKHWGCASIAPRNAPAFARAVEAAHGIGEQE